MSKTKKKKLLSISKLKRKADAVFSQFIRNRDKHCYTCMRTLPVKELQNGHYISRSYISTRYDETNCHAQCYGCNIMKKGNYPVYSIRMINEYGVEILTTLDRLKNQPILNTRGFLEEVIKQYD